MLNLTAPTKIYIYTPMADMRKGISPRGAGDLAAEIRLFADLGVDGVFSDNPGVAVGALR